MSDVTIQKCPVCDGTGLVSRPPGVTGDMPYWTSSHTGPYVCRCCNGDGVLRVYEHQTTVRQFSEERGKEGE